MKRKVHLSIRFQLGNSFSKTKMKRKVHLSIRFQSGNSFSNTKMKRKVHLCIRFQLGNSFSNTKMKRKVHLCIRFQLGNSFSNAKMKRKVHLCIRSQLGNSFSNTKVKRKVHLSIRFQLGNSFSKTKMKRKVNLSIRFQLGNSFSNTKMKRKVHLCIRFQLGNSFSNTKVKKIHLSIRFQLGNSFSNTKMKKIQGSTLFLAFNVGGGLLIACRHYRPISREKKVKNNLQKKEAQTRRKSFPAAGKKYVPPSLASHVKTYIAKPATRPSELPKPCLALRPSRRFKRSPDTSFHKRRTIQETKRSAPIINEKEQPHARNFAIEATCTCTFNCSAPALSGAAQPKSETKQLPSHRSSRRQCSCLKHVSATLLLLEKNENCPMCVCACALPYCGI